MIWLLNTYSPVIKFKQYFNTDHIKNDTFALNINNFKDNNFKDNNIILNIYQTDNLILFEDNDKKYCYEYTEEYFDKYILYTYKKVNHHRMLFTNKDYYYYQEDNKNIQYKIDKNKLYFKTNDVTSLIELL